MIGLNFMKLEYYWLPNLHRNLKDDAVTPCLLRIMLVTLAYLALLLTCCRSSPLPSNIQRKAINIAKNTGKVTGGITGGIVGLAGGAVKTVYHLGKALAAPTFSAGFKHIGYGLASPFQSAFAGAGLGSSTTARSNLAQNLRTFAPGSKSWDSFYSMNGLGLTTKRAKSLDNLVLAQNRISDLSKTNIFVPFNGLKRTLKHRQTSTSNSINDRIQDGPNSQLVATNGNPPPLPPRRTDSISLSPVATHGNPPPPPPKPISSISLSPLATNGNPPPLPPRRTGSVSSDPKIFIEDLLKSKTFSNSPDLSLKLPSKTQSAAKIAENQVNPGILADPRLKSSNEPVARKSSISSTDSGYDSPPPAPSTPKIEKIDPLFIEKISI